MTNTGKCRLKFKRRVEVGSGLTGLPKTPLLWFSCDRADHDHGEKSARYPHPREDDLMVDPEGLYAEMTGGAR